MYVKAVTISNLSQYTTVTILCIRLLLYINALLIGLLLLINKRFLPTENMDCRMPMGTPHTVLMSRRTPTPGRASRRVMAATLNRL